jgi:DNA mismatch repair ATPase MutS
MLKRISTPAVAGFFDHELHSGASTQRNAIRVLERLGFPASIIAEALATVVAIDAPKILSDDMTPSSHNHSKDPGVA